MKAKIYLQTLLLLAIFVIAGYSQSQFDVHAYAQFLREHQNMEASDVQALYPLQQTYYKGNQQYFSVSDFAYLDTVIEKLHLTKDELDLLKQNYFVVTERLSERCFGQAFHHIYGMDLPVFVSTDAILQAVHESYDMILLNIEVGTLEPQLIELLSGLYNAIPQLIDKYDNNENLQTMLADIDLYITIAYSLELEELQPPHFANIDDLNRLWDAIFDESMVSMALFSEHSRNLDFSQFKPRGHYTDTFWDENQGKERSLANYFRAMMWLGRIDFLLTTPPSFGEENWKKLELRRMAIDACMLNELLDMSNTRVFLDKNNEIIDALIGESDNLTPQELAGVCDSLQITNPIELLDDTTYQKFFSAISHSVNAEQKILSNFFIMDPFSSQPDTLPVSFKLMGQRFILDSYIFSQLVYDRIIFQDKKVWRPMPNPLDAMFVLGNDDALYLLNDELSVYKYGSQLAALRYLADSYDEKFWERSFYNLWLNSIRTLNPKPVSGYLPFFARTAAWHQEKLNTQLASWTQLRHDNLLYAKQSYTGGTMCSYPHSFVEPNIEFFSQMENFALRNKNIFDQILTNDDTLTRAVKYYFDRFYVIMSKLKEIVRKEISREAFTNDEIEFLKKMLFTESGSGAPPFSGWYAELFFNPEKGSKIDYLIADVHTQPTDQGGNIVGRVLHVGVGKVNLGIFLADSPSNDFRPTCFVGPVMSYYEKYTSNFQRLTDEEWAAMVEQNQLPVRPNWVNLYLADENGNKRPAGIELPGIPFTAVDGTQPSTPEHFRVIQNYPNPFNPKTRIQFTLPRAEQVKITVYDVLGAEVVILANQKLSAGTHTFDFDAIQLPGGLYFCTIQTETGKETIKMLLVK